LNLPETIATALSLTYVLDRTIKASLVDRFFSQPTSALPHFASPPTVALIQPVTRGATKLAAHLDARAILNYPGEIRHLIVCDAADSETQAVCRAALPQAEIILAQPDVGDIASKVAKMAAGVAHIGNADVLCFVDDDILLPPNALQTLVAPLYSSMPAGATFGLACQTSWGNAWESLMSGFVNANALTGYVPLTFLIDPYTITGHIFALRRTVFEQIGGMNGMSKRFDDDHEIARRVRALGLTCKQTPLVYQVENALSSFAAYHTQLRRWFVMPRQAMVPHLTSDERFVSALLGFGNLLPPLVLFLAIFAPGEITVGSAVLTLLAFVITYLRLEGKYLPAHTPRQRLSLLPLIAFLTPLHVLIALALPGDTITWRGQTYHARRGGTLEKRETK
jgi:ceramide glucosyltransferase